MVTLTVEGLSMGDETQPSKPDMRELQELSLARLAEVDGGRLSVAFQTALQRVLADCDDRPGEKKVRTITLQIAVKPVMEGNFCEAINWQAVIADNVPKRLSKIYNSNIRKRNGQLKAMVRIDSPDDADQGTLFEE